MAQSLEEQILTAERSLGERMISHALVIIRSWLNELGENNPYEKAFLSIQKRHNALFASWLSSDDAQSDEQLDALTSEAYRLMDAVYVAIRLQRGLSPDMHGFNPTLISSVMNYFMYCLHIQEEDYAWLHDALRDSDRAALGLIAISALSQNLRECFAEEGMMAIIDGIGSEIQMISDQCTAHALLLFMHYDSRIDCFPQLQDALIQALRDVDDTGGTAFVVLCAIVRSIRPAKIQALEVEEKEEEHVLKQMEHFLQRTGLNHEELELQTTLPKSEQEYMSQLIQYLPDTWIGSMLVDDNEQRMRMLAVTYLKIGRMDLMWEHPDEAEKVLIQLLREDAANPIDYINYGHCMMLKGDRIMAYENYRQARLLCGNAKEFFALFRPDRKALVDHGIPVEQVYLIEDQLLKGDA